MSDGDFTDAEAVRVAAQIRALRAGPRRRWRRFRRHELVCSACHEPVAEVMKTDPRDSIVYRDRDRQDRIVALGTAALTIAPSCHCSRTSANYLDVRLIRLAVEDDEEKLILDRKESRRAPGK